MNQQQEQQGQQGQGDLGELIVNVDSALMSIAEIMTQSSVPDEIKQRIVAVVQEYKDIMQSITGGGQGQSQQGAQPMTDQGQPYNPAGV